MSIEDIHSIDALSIHEETGSTVLTIIDDMDWDDIDAHLQLIQEKVYRYLDFVESGELDEKFPKYSKRPLTFRFYSQCKIPEVGIELMNNLKEYLINSNRIKLLCLVQDEFDNDSWISVL